MRRRSVGFLERDGNAWACFLVTWRDPESRWHGYFSFRPRDGEAGEDEIRTADIFLEGSEEEVDRKARELGRPLLGGLLASALHTTERKGSSTPRLRRWFRDLLTRSSRELSDGGSERTDPGNRGAMHSLYESYRMDQVAHFICLVDPEDFRGAVEEILDGRPFDFGARDKLQFAMMVVDHIEERIPLPPFEVWLEDYEANRAEYELYAHTLHRAGRLP